MSFPSNNSQAHAAVSRLGRPLLALAFGLCLIGSAYGQNFRGYSAEEIEGGTDIGSGVWLDVLDKQHFALYTPPLAGIPGGGLILLHDRGGHPNWPSVIRPLREKLPKEGWATLSIYTPQLDSVTDSDEITNRISAQINSAFDFLVNQGFSNVILIGHGSGASAGAMYLNNNKGVQGFVAISLGTPVGTALPELEQTLENIGIPIFDIYGSQDLYNVTHGAEKRALAARKSGSKNPSSQRSRSGGAEFATEPGKGTQGYIIYRQLEVMGANHSFTGFDDLLVKRIEGWLQRHARGTTIHTP